MPELHIDIAYAAIGAALLAALVWATKLFFGEGVKHAASRFWPATLRIKRSTIGTRDLKRYRNAVSANYDSHVLGFLQDAPIKISDVYVPLQHQRHGWREDIYETIRNELRTVVLGAAGAGKSVLLKNSMVKWSTTPSYLQRIPVLVELLRRNIGDESLYDLIINAFKINNVKRPDAFLSKALKAGQLTIFFDGLDEVLTERRDVVVDELKRFSEDYPRCQIVVTCRDAVYDHDLRPNFQHEVRVEGFDDAAIERFIRLWLMQTRRHRDVRAEVAQLIAALQDSPAILILARSPLLLTMIMALHDADPGIGPMLTNSRPEFYESAVLHLLRRDRDLGRQGVAIYKAGHKTMVLRAIALTAQGAMAAGTDRRAIPESELIDQINKVLARFNLDSSHGPKMLEEIVSRSGLLVKVDEGNLLYEFPHLTLQEYLAAMELADHPDRLLNLYEQNPSRWRETIKFWCGGANRDSTEIVSHIFNGGDKDKLLALECLAEVRQIDDDAAKQILFYFMNTLDRSFKGQHLVIGALGAVAADPGPRGKMLLDHLREVALSQSGYIQTNAISALAATRSRSAIEVISELADHVGAARGALRTMGEQAIPVLAERAKQGLLSAVDDIAAVGTASAGLALAKLVSREDNIAVHAAWRLAALIDNEEVEEELVLSDLDLSRIEGRYDWVWKPFEQGEPLQSIMARVAYLIDNSDKDQIPRDVDDIDPRIALPVGVRGAAMSRTLNDKSSRKRPHTAEFLLYFEGYSESNSKYGYPPRRAAFVDEKRVRSEAESQIYELNVPPVYRHLLSSLSTQVLVTVAINLEQPKFHPNERDWIAIWWKPKARWLIQSALVGWLGLVFIVYVVLGLASAAFAPWGPPWLRWTTLTIAAILILLLFLRT
jgi:hypothetical protein